MSGLEIFKIWAPEESLWSDWAKPVLFAEMQPGIPNASHVEWPKVDVSQDQGTAIVVDLPGEQSVKVGVALARDGYRPVPLFNSAAGPASHLYTSALVDVEPTRRMLEYAASALTGIYLPPNAPPAFLLDANRKGGGTLNPNRFDNRSIVFPQDFPSATFLQAHGIHRVLLYQESERFAPADDLAHVLMRWQQAGIQLFSYNTRRSPYAEPLKVTPPSQFKMLWHRALAVAGLRRNSAGGFGSIIPEAQSRSG